LALLPGTRPGVYAVTAQIGEGGPPSLAQDVTRASASLTGAQARIWQ